MILSPATIRHLKLVHPCVDAQRSHGVSFGLGHAGYDVRIAKHHWLYPGQFQLGSTMERFILPDNVLGVVHDKSTWARKGLSVFNTILEPGWEGHLTLELVNHHNEGLYIPSGVGIAQVVFHLLDCATDNPYRGKYQNQKAGIQEAIFESAN